MGRRLASILGEVAVAVLMGVSLLMVDTRTTYAYLDPGTGSMVLQVLAGVLLGAIFTARVYWRRAKSLLLNRVLRRKLKADGSDEAG